VQDIVGSVGSLLPRRNRSTAPAGTGAATGAGFGGSDPGANGGTCPTFVQGGDPEPAAPETSPDAPLVARIDFPPAGSLVNANVPIFGVAGGPRFEHYRVEYGPGTDPSTWTVIATGTRPVTEESTPPPSELRLHADAHLYGTLGDWHTGLRNWSHLPCNPPDEPIRLSGRHTLRLIVTGSDGAAVEDRITVDAGTVVAQALPGEAASADGRVRLRVPEHALAQSFRIYDVQPLEDIREPTPPACAGCELVSRAYRIREPGDRFIMPVALEFDAPAAAAPERDPRRVGIASWDAGENAWVTLPTEWDPVAARFSASITELPAPRAVFALLHDPERALSQRAAAEPSHAEPAPVRPGVLVDDTFEDGLGSFEERDLFVGARLQLDAQATQDGSRSLRLTNKNFGGTFSATLLGHPFDVRDYGTLTFDYRIPAGVMIDLFARAGARWYRLRLTGDATAFDHRGVNVVDLGGASRIIADDTWHNASIDLEYSLRQKTRETRIDELVLANWEVAGYRKLEFGRNPRSAVYHLDNVRITGLGERHETPPVMLVDDFEVNRSTNLLGGGSGTYSTPGSRFFEATTEDVTGHAGDKSRALRLAFDMRHADAYGGWWTSVKSRNLSSYDTVAFRLFGADGSLPPLSFGIRNLHGDEGKTDVRPYASGADEGGWREVRIPLSAMGDITDFSAPDVSFFAAVHDGDNRATSVAVDDLRFERHPYGWVTDFEESSDRTLLGGLMETNQSGAAACSTGIMLDTDDRSNSVLRISYGGTIGRDYGLEGGGFSYASWRAALKGLDARDFDALAIRIRGESGGETPNLYLVDAGERFAVRANELPAVTDAWQTFEVPLERFRSQGVDLSHLEAVELVFEWEKQSGTIYLDDLRFR